MATTNSRTPPSFLDSLIRFMVWSSIVGTMLVPLLLIAYFNSAVLVAFPFLGGGDDTFSAVFGKIMAPPPSSGIVTGDGASRAAQVARLRSMMARPEMSAGAASRLNFVGLTFDDKPEPTPSGIAIDRDGYRRMTLDLGQLPNEAVVVIADQPIRWTVAGVNSAWGLIGFEGLAPFDIANGRAGMIAGYRIAAFGARETARPADPFHADQRGRRILCDSVKAWSGHFGIAPGQMNFALVTNATSIGSRSGAITSDGQARVSWTGATLASLCKQR